MLSKPNNLRPKYEKNPQTYEKNPLYNLTKLWYNHYIKYIVKVRRCIYAAIQYNKIK